MSLPSVLIIGAGVGGLATAAHLARQGCRVTIVEKNAQAGGRCSQFERDGHVFDTGPTLLVMPLLFEAEFASLGADLRQRLNLQRVDPTYRLVFDDGRELSLTSDLKSLSSQLEAFEPGSFSGFLRYLEEGDRHYHEAVKHLVNRDFRTAVEFFTPAHLPLLFSLKPLHRHYEHVGAFFSEPRLKAAFTFQDVYMGLSPFEAPATFSMMSYTELAHGVWYPRGGMYQVVNALVDLAREAGVTFEFNATVSQIDVRGGLAVGVSLADGRSFAADVVVANADLPYVFDRLLPADRQSAALAKKRFSCSAISFFWGIDRPVPELGPHTLFLADDYRENFTSIDRDHGLPANPSLYIHAPARLDPAMAPAGQDTVTAIVPVGHIDPTGTQDWATIRDAARSAVFKRLHTLGVTDLDRHIKFEVNYTPLSWRKRYNLMYGATHGLCHNLMQLGYLRPHNRHDRYRNLYFVGASTHPGTGLPTALVSARLVSRRILDEQDHVAA